ncbi:MAG: RHS repeat protein, partial [Calditrichaeota bacterium]
MTGTTLGQVKDQVGYNAFGEVAWYRAAAGGGRLLEEEYERDGLGRIAVKREAVEGVTTVYRYLYDGAGRLQEVWTDGFLTGHYEYDQNGNRVVKRTLLGQVTAEYDAQDRLLRQGNWEYSYDAAGDLASKRNRVTGEATRYEYDVFGNLRRVELPDGRAIEYVIDGQNRRIGKKVDGVLVQGWLYGSQLGIVAELDGTGNVVTRFVPGGMVKD